MVAMEFAASWKPFMKSKASASSTSSASVSEYRVDMHPRIPQAFCRITLSRMSATSWQRSVAVSSSS